MVTTPGTRLISATALLGQTLTLKHLHYDVFETLHDLGDDTPPSRGSSVPKAGGQKSASKKKGGEPDAGMEPQPQG